MRRSALVGWVVCAGALLLAGCSSEEGDTTGSGAAGPGGTGGGASEGGAGAGASGATGGLGGAGVGGTGGAAGDDITISGRRFVRGGAPFFPVGNFLTSQDDAGPRTHVYLSDDISDDAREEMLSIASGAGYNVFSIYTYNEDDYAGEAITPFASGGFGGALDEAKLAIWQTRVQAILAAGMHPVIWLVPDDAPGIHGAPAADLEAYFTQMVDRFDALPVLWIMALEVDEYWDAPQVNQLGSHLAGLTGRPVGIHQLPDATTYMTEPWADFGALQYGFGHDWTEIFDRTVQVAAELGGKPLVACEYDLSGGDNDDRLGLAGAFGGAAGVGNGAPPGLATFIESLPDGMTSSRDDANAYLMGDGVTATADMASLTFSK